MNLLTRLKKRGCKQPSQIIQVLIELLIILLTTKDVTGARFKRCFTCRSRGALGDCRDPFDLNSTTFEDSANTKSSIEATPCASGWCSKIIENDLGDSIAATERLCMPKPPTDNEERCSETLFENQRDRKVFLCMCYGDLCNSAIRNHSLIHTFVMTFASTFITAICSLPFVMTKFR